MSAPTHLRNALLRVEGHWVWYKRYWLTTAVFSVLQPVAFLAAIGIGFGSQVRPGAATGGLDYLVWLAPAMLAVGTVQNGIMESSWPVLSGFKWQQDYWAVTATPISAAELFAGQLIWAGLRLCVTAALFLAVAAAVGAVGSPAVLLALPIAVLGGVACAGPVMALAATLRREGNGFNVLFRFVVVPMTLFAGTFFPVASLPVWVRPLAWITPLYHATSLSRAASFGTGTFGGVLVHLGYLLALLLVGILLGVWRFRRRLVV